MLLLDTNALLWSLRDDPRLGTAARTGPMVETNVMTRSGLPDASALLAPRARRAGGLSQGGVRRERRSDGRSALGRGD